MEQMVQRRESQTNLGKDIKRAAFRVFSALAATDEEIRKKIIDTDDLMNQLVLIFVIISAVATSNIANHTTFPSIE